MAHRSVSRLLLVLLGVAVVAVVARFTLSGGSGGGFVNFGEGWNVDRLRHEAFRLERPARIAVSAVGSFENDTALAAYPWILRREDREVVWQMTPQAAERGRGTLALVADTLTLPAGTYDAYFTTFGDPLLPAEEGESLGDRLAELLRFGNRAWYADQSRWTFRLDLLDPDAVAQRLRWDEAREAAPQGPDLLWAGGPAGDDAFLAYGFEVRQPTDVHIDALGEIYREPVDIGWIHNLATGERVWEMTQANTEWAGGSLKNRRFRGTVRLQPGIYRAVFQTDRSHAYDDWTANPPLDPAAYGLFLRGDAGRVGPFDPWQRLPKVVELTNVGNNALEVARFTLTDSLRAGLYAVGEIGERAYDHAWLLREGGEVVWEMDEAETRHAGGETRNRVAEAYLELAPGTYTLHFETDGSHAPGDWRSEPPHNPERWGVTLFALSPNFQPVEVTRWSERDAAPAPPPAPPAGPGGLPVRLAPLGNRQEEARTFELEEETRLRIYAVGELLLSERADFGWITDDTADEVVWEMTRSNTEPAGGARKNRVFDGTVTFSPGTYTVHFRTDGSHAFGDFSQGAPRDPMAWGITVERAGGPTVAPMPPEPPGMPDLPDVEALREDAERQAREALERARQSL